MSREQRSYWRAGLVVGVVLGVVAAALINQGNEYDLDDDTPFLRLFGGMAIGGLMGAGLGSVIHRDRWETMDWPPPAPEPGSSR